MHNKYDMKTRDRAGQCQTAPEKNRSVIKHGHQKGVALQPCTNSISQTQTRYTTDKHQYCTMVAKLHMTDKKEDWG